MRMRRKKWAVPELEAAPFHINNPVSCRGCWRAQFARPDQPLTVEIGCGKGGAISRLAVSHRETNFLAIDLISNVLGVCKRNIEQAYAGHRTPDNILIAAWDCERIGEILSSEDRVDRLLINFCNPWPKAGHQKRRLTHTRQLLRYRAFLAPGAVLQFKTDDGTLFLATHDYLAEADFGIFYETDDLHAHPEIENTMTEHEAMFSAQGIPIRYLAARMLEQDIPART